jgi:hypothetical protein
LSRAETALIEALAKKAGFTRLGRIVGLDSIASNLAAEDDAYSRSMGGNAAADAAGEEMKITAGGDVNVYPPPPTDPQPPATIAVDEARSPAPTGLLAQAAIVAALLGAGGVATTGGLAAMGMFDRPEAEVIAAPVDEDTQYEVRLAIE